MNNERFGFSIDEQIVKKQQNKQQKQIIVQKETNNIFEFNLDSNKRLGNEMKYKLQKNQSFQLIIFDDNKDELIQFDNLKLMKKSIKHSECKSSQKFDYKHLKMDDKNKINPLCETDETLFEMKRLIVIQMN